MSYIKLSGLATLCFATLFLLGCGGYEKSPVQTAADTDTHDHDDHEHAEDGEHEHGEWWCAAHGVPEAECALCDTKLVAGFKEKGDWCEDHSRPNSQCFKCDPELFNKFAARYEAKYGKKPPKPTM